MSAPASKPAVLLAAAVGGMVLLIGWVSSARRAATELQALPPIEAWHGNSSHEAVLVAPPRLLELGAPAPTGVEEPSRATRPGRLSGFVLREDGALAANALLVLGKQHERANAEGKFEMQLPADVSTADLVAYAPGFEPALRPAYGAQLDPSGENHVRLVLGPVAQSLTGRVVDADGLPRKGWTVELDEPDLLRDLGLRDNVRTDGKGVFTIPDVPGGVHVVRVFKQRRELAVRSDPAVAGELGLTVVVPDE
jgi:hypothetical protein